MDELAIPYEYVELNGENIPGVFASVIHEGLEEATRLRDWMPRRIEKLPHYRENYHWLKIERNPEPGSVGGRPGYDWILCLDMAKEIAMMSATPRGAAIRQRLIRIEQDWRQRMQKELLQDYHRNHPLPMNLMQKLEVQVELSKHYNVVNHIEGGAQQAMIENAELCRRLSDLRQNPRDYIRLANDVLKYPSKDRTSGIQVLRRYEPHSAMAMSGAKHLILAGNPKERVLDIMEKQGKPFFKRLNEELGFDSGGELDA